MTDHPEPSRFESRACLPADEEILEHRIELLLGRIPRLEEVVVQSHLVDRRDGRLGVRVGGEQDPLRLGVGLACLEQVFGPFHSRHPLVGQQQRDGVPPGAQFAQQLEALGSRAGPQDAVALPEAAPQVASNGGENHGLIIDGDYRGPALLHPGPVSAEHRGGWNACLAGDLRDPHGQLILEAPAPLLPGLERADQRVRGCGCMGGGVFGGGVVAASDMPAGKADPQMQPDAPFAQTVLATVDLLGKLGDGDRLEMCADLHGLMTITPGGFTGH